MLRTGRRLFVLALVSLVLALCGLARTGYLDCSMIEHGWPPYASDYVEARGFPILWLISGKNLCATSLAWWQRILVVRFSISYAILLALTFTLARVILSCTRGIRKQA